MTYPTIRMKFALAKSFPGAWGDDPERGEGVLVLRSTEIGLDGSIQAVDPAVRKLSRQEISATRLRTGDLLVVKSSGSDLHLGKAGFVTKEIAAMGFSFSNFIQSLRFSDDFNARFVWYFANSSEVKRQIRLISSTTTGLQNLSGAIIGELQVPKPPLGEQRRIANFLDAETVRIDNMAQVQQQVRAGLHEREASLLEAILVQGILQRGNNTFAASKPLRFLVDQTRPIMYGIVLPGPDVSDGIPIIKGGDVAARRFNPAQLSRTSVEIESRYRRSRVRSGDILVAIRGSGTIGEIARVPAEAEGANLTQDTARVSVGSGVCGEWLELVLCTPFVTHQIHARTTGATIKGINIWDLERINVPTPELTIQRSLASELRCRIHDHQRIVGLIDQQLKLLAERRRALITAAVTGEIDVSTASGRGIG